MRKFILASILFIILFSSVSCSLNKTLKVIVLDTKGNPVEKIRILPEYISEEEKKAIASVLECKNCREKRLKLERR